jgi:hypothetical protein
MRAKDAHQVLRDFDIDEEEEEFLVRLLSSRKTPRDELRRVIDVWSVDLPPPKHPIRDPP